MRRLQIWLALLASLIASTPAGAEWRRAESPNFIVYADSGESRLRERILQLEDFHRLLADVTGIRTPPLRNKLTVYLLDDAGDLRQVRNVSGSVGGLYSATAIGVAAYVSASTSQGNQLLHHEYAHHFMYQFATIPYPVWFVEGFAEYFMTARFTDRDIELGDIPENRIRPLSAAGWLPMERVLSGTLAGLDGLERARFYSQSWLAVHYFYSNADRFAQLRRYMTEVGNGADATTALQRATGLTPDAFERALMDHIRGGRITFRRMSRAAAPEPVPVAVTTLPPSANELISARAALHIGQRADFGERLLSRVRDIAARYGDDPFARRVLAQAETMHGDGAAADRLLDALMAEFPNDVELPYLKGMRHLRAAAGAEDRETNNREAARWFGRAFSLDENHYQTLYRFAQSQHGQPTYFAENNRNVLMLAYSLAPQVAEIRMAAAGILLARREFALAESLLLPLSTHPHDERLAESARRMLDRVRAGRSAGQ